MSDRDCLHCQILDLVETWTAAQGWPADGRAHSARTVGAVHASAVRSVLLALADVIAQDVLRADQAMMVRTIRETLPQTVLHAVNLRMEQDPGYRALVASANRSVEG